MAKSVAINVGANTEPEWGGFRGPISPNGSFEFIHIPWKEKYGRIEPPPKKYEQYKTYNSYIKQRLKDKYIHILESPDFCHCTYASTVNEGIPAPANKHIFKLNLETTSFSMRHLILKARRRRRRIGLIQIGELI